MEEDEDDGENDEGDDREDQENDGGQDIKDEKMSTTRITKMARTTTR